MQLIHMNRAYHTHHILNNKSGSYSKFAFASYKFTGPSYPLASVSGTAGEFMKGNDDLRVCLLRFLNFLIQADIRRVEKMNIANAPRAK